MTSLVGTALLRAMAPASRRVVTSLGHVRRGLRRCNSPDAHDVVTPGSRCSVPPGTRAAHECDWHHSVVVGLATLVALFALATSSIAQTPVTIIPPNLSGATVGTLPGEAAVQPSGAASYRIPIRVPPGTAGIEPSLSLSYDSLRGDSGLGLGWQVSGLSSITRCPANLAVDNVAGKVAMNANDRYCLDGQRLLLVNGTYGAAAEYRTEVDGIQRIKSLGSNAANGPTSWTVETRSGRTMTYGATTDSYLESASGKTIVWALSKVEDLRGTYLTVSYTKNVATGEHYPSTILYAGNAAQNLAPYAAVRFEYEASQRPDIGRRFIAGSRLAVAKRLAKVVTAIDVASGGTGGTTVHEYRLAYQLSSHTQRSVLASVSWCNAAGQCLPATSFIYSQRTALDNGFDSTNWGVLSANYHNAPQPALADLMASIKIVDMNGDGKADLLRSNEDGTWQVCLSNGSTFACQSWAGGPVQWTSKTFTGDFNGDGMTDVVYAAPGSATWRVCLSTGSALNCQDWAAAAGQFADSRTHAWPPSFSYLVADFDGDGRDDVLVRTSWSTGQTLCVSTGAGFSCSPFNAPGYFDPNMLNYTEPINQCSVDVSRWSPIMGDFTGDKRVDVLPLAYQDPKCRALWPAVVNNSISWCETGDTAAICTADLVTNLRERTGLTGSPGGMVGDLNGDGYADFVLGSLDSPDRMKICLGTGTGVECSDYVPGIPTLINSLHVADFDGDGRPDLLQQGRICSVASANLNSSTITCNAWTLPQAQSDELGPMWADFNGDGKTDFAFYNKTTGMWRIALGKGPAPDLMIGVTNGLGHQTAFEYADLGKASVYTGGSPAAYPKRNSPGGVNVVSKLKVSNLLPTSANPDAGWFVTDYRYVGRRSHLRGRGDLGFEEIVAIDRVKNITTRRVLSQDHPHTGMATIVQATQANGVLLTHATNVLGSVPTAGGALYPYVASTLEQRKDLSNATLPQVSRSIPAPPTGIDAYGNVLSSTETITDGSDVFSTVTTNTYQVSTSPFWLVNLLKRSVVAKTAPNTISVPGAPTISITPTTWSFGTVAKGGLSSQKLFTVTNSGTASAGIAWPLNYTSATSATGSYIVSSSTCGTLAAGASCTVGVRYSAGCTGGTRAATLTAQGANFAPVVVSLSATTASTGVCGLRVAPPEEPVSSATPAGGKP